MEEISSFEVGNIIAKYKIFFTEAGCPHDMYVEITETETGKYCAECNYSIWSVDQANQYQHNGYYDTKESALTSLLNSLKMFIKNDYETTEYCWMPRQYKGYVILGSGELATKEAFRKQNFTNKIADVYS
jgi:hypothetical protein